MLIAWRRQTAYLLRQFVHYAYKIPTRQKQFKARKSGKNLQITIFSRDNSAYRSLSGEDLIAAALRREGHNVTVSRSTGVRSLQQQLEEAMHTDVVVGVHGAGIAHGLFASTRGVIIEMKTSYGFNLALMAVISDARLHTHVQLDVRKYTDKAPVGTVDEALVQRVVSALNKALEMQLHDQDINQVKHLNTPGVVDVILGPTSQSGQFDHILGPFNQKDPSELVKVCQNLGLYHYQRIIENHDPLSLHCRQCCISRR